MKKVVLFIILSASNYWGSSNIFSQKSILIGKVYNPIDKEINLSYYKNYITNEVVRKTFSLSENNTFQIEFNTKDTFQCIFNYLSYSINLLMFPNDTSYLVFDGQKMLSSINFEGKNKYVHLLDARLTSTFERWNDKVVMNEINNLSFADYKIFVDDLFSKKVKYINDFQKQYKLSPYQTDYVINNQLYWKVTKYLEYDYIKESQNSYEFSINKTTEILDSIHFTVTNNENNFYFNNLLNHYLYKLTKNEHISKQKVAQTIVQKIQKFVTITVDKINIVKYPGSDEIIGEVLRDQKFQSVNCYTDEAFKYKFNDSIFYNAKFTKIKFGNNTGWIPLIGVTMEDALVEENYQNEASEADKDHKFDENTQSLIACILLVREVNKLSKDSLNYQLANYPKKYSSKKYLNLLDSIIEQWQQNMYEDGRFKTPIFNEFNIANVLNTKLLKQYAKLGMNNFAAEIVENQTGVGAQFVSGMTKNEQLLPYQVTINEDLFKYYNSNKILVIDFWATWCLPCIRQMKNNQEIIEQTNLDSIEFVFINIDSDKKMAKDYIASEKLLGKHIFDTNKELFNNLNVKGVPTMMVFDRNRRVIYNSTDLWEHPLTFILDKYIN